MSEPHRWHRAVRLDGRGVTLVLAQRGDQLPEPIHWGASLPADEDLLGFAQALRKGLSGGALDALSPLSLLPEEGRSSLAHPGLLAAAPEGTRWLTSFAVERLEAADERCAIAARDAEAGLSLMIELVFEDDVLCAQATLGNEGDGALVVQEFAAPSLPIAEWSDAILGFGGRWIGEFDAFEVPWRPGQHVREARLGRTSHEHFPGAVCLTPGTTKTIGEAWAVHLAWSGGHKMVAEELADGRRHVQLGALMRPGEVILQPGETFATPTLHALYTDAGLSGIARGFQAHLRRRLGQAKRPRPITCNSWEAVYFDHDLPRLRRLVDAAAALGVERFVLDDGWFGRRDDDTSSLGDWVVDARKWPDGLGPLIDHVVGNGMEFGLWFEPEMVNPDSDLFGAHPDWVLADPLRPPLTGRNQMVLDLARPEVGAYLFEKIDAMLSAHPIAYLKWDHNRVLIAASGADGRAGTVRQTEAFYALLTRLSAAHPQVEFESCASGGGRIDYRVLELAGRVWLSDSNDAVERMRIQHVASLFLPPEVVGSHVGPRFCHTSGRVLAMSARAWTAASRHLGLELDLAELTDEEWRGLARVIAWHKANRGLLHAGVPTLLDLDEPDAYGEVVASNGAFAAFISYTKAPSRAGVRPVRLAGLDPARRYAAKLVNIEDVHPVLSKAYASPLVSKEGLTLSGAALMGAGLQLPVHAPGTVWVLEGRAVA